MTWTYIAPSLSEAKERDKVRFLVGDTVESEQLIQDEEIDFSLSEFSDIKLAAALVLRALAARLTRFVDLSVGGVSSSCSQKAAGYKALADSYDPGGVTITAFALPAFGGLSQAEKEELADNDDGIQPFFSRSGDDIPGGPDGSEDQSY